ncbi:MAG TPA: choice-of-anchor X domain-containing protein, partial [Chitinophagaceae bacterium]|nr:choice-of-anchor X domain-containing protein [Chitinophagaceae bacterium]
MKTSGKYTLLGSVIIFTTALVSWDHSNYSTKELATPLWSYLNEKNAQEFAGAEITTFSADDDWFKLPPESAKPIPAAEDVLIQKIPGDNNHLLMMAFYSKENYPGQSVTINNGSQLVFRDDGKGDDKTAGDGLFTAKITADVNEFRKIAINIDHEMKKSNYKPVRYINNAMIVDPDASESFDVQALANNEMVSLTSLTTGSRKVIDSVRSHSVLITDLSVVEDPSRTWNSCAQTGNVNGPWTFKTLMKQLASQSPSNIATDAEVSDFVKNWLNKWVKTIIINGDTVAPRPLVKTKILDPWLKRSKGAGAPDGQLDMKLAPFKLTAIV